MSEIRFTLKFNYGQRLEVAHGDLTLERVDAIVNATNAYLKNSGGVAAAIVMRGGEVIQRECDEWVSKRGPVSNAQPAFTSAGKLACRYVIHAVGPVWGEGAEVNKLSLAVRGVLQMADRLRLESVAMPAISTGVFGFPKEEAARVFLDTIVEYYDEFPESKLKLVRITIIDPPTLKAFLQVFRSESPLGRMD